MKTLLLTASPAEVRTSPKRAKPSTAARYLSNWESSETRNSERQDEEPIPSANDPGSWRYRAGKGAPKVPVVALLLAGSLHAIALFGFNDPEVAPVASDDVTALEVVFMEMPPLEELDEPEEIFDGDSMKEEIDPGQFVPMQADIPTFNTDAAFVQQMDMKSLLPAPEFDTAVLSIPKRISHTRVAPSTMKNVFNIADLDRIPEPIFQPAPVFPRHLKHEVRVAEILVEFIVDAKGKVVWAKVVSASHSGFEDAAILGVSRWQFRAGMKNGKRVNSRMQVPLRFRVNGDLSG
jgi:TonB family protein